VDTARLGREGEEQAARYFQGKGLAVVARNVRSKCGEIDLVVLDGDAVVFVEVKAWKTLGIEDLELSLTARKRRRIIETAKYFLASHREYNSMSVRFDIVFIGGDGMRHLASAFTERV